MTPIDDIGAKIAIIRKAFQQQRELQRLDQIVKQGEKTTQAKEQQGEASDQTNQSKTGLEAQFSNFDQFGNFNNFPQFTDFSQFYNFSQSQV